MAIQDAWSEIIRENIQEYITTVKFDHPDFSVSEFKKQLQNIIGMIPAVDIKWKTESFVNELKRDSGVKDYITTIDKVSEIKVSFLNKDIQPITLHYII